MHLLSKEVKEAMGRQVSHQGPPGIADLLFHQAVVDVVDIAIVFVVFHGERVAFDKHGDKDVENNHHHAEAGNGPQQRAREWILLCQLEHRVVVEAGGHCKHLVKTIACKHLVNTITST